VKNVLRRRRLLPSTSIALKSRLSWSTDTSPLPVRSRFRNAANAWSDVAPNCVTKLSVHSPRDTDPFPVIRPHRIRPPNTFSTQYRPYAQLQTILPKTCAFLQRTLVNVLSEIRTSKFEVSTIAYSLQDDDRLYSPNRFNDSGINE